MKIEEFSEKMIYGSSNIYHRNRLSPISFTVILFKTK